MGTAEDLTFLVPPGEVADWRMVVLYDAAAGTGALAALPGTAAEVAGPLGLDPHALGVVFDALGSWGIVERDEHGRYRPGAAAPAPELSPVLRHHARAVASWSTAVDASLRGRSLERRTGLADPELFIDALSVTARKAAPDVVDVCLARFPDARRVIDLGGGHGEYSLEFARRGLEVTLQDLPAMVEVVRGRGRLAEAGVALFEGSFFEQVPPGPFDLAFCAGITHTFDGAHNQTLFANLRPVVVPGGGVAVVTMLRRRHPIAGLFAVQMMANGNGGDTHGEEDYRAWLAEAGFAADAALVDLPGRPQSVLFAV